MATTIPKTATAVNNNNNNNNNNAPKTPNKTNDGRRQKKQKRTFMLHDPSDMSPLGRFTSTDWRYAALKAASRGHTKILLRETGTREVREFSGAKVEIEPKNIVRDGRTITYTHKPAVKSMGKPFVYNGVVDDTAGNLNPNKNNVTTNTPNTPNTPNKNTTA